MLYSWSNHTLVSTIGLNLYVVEGVGMKRFVVYLGIGIFSFLILFLIFMMQTSNIAQYKMMSGFPVFQPSVTYFSLVNEPAEKRI